MNGHLQGTSIPAMVHAIEENTIESLLALGRAGGGEERDDPRIHWIIGGSPLAYHNGVVRANLSAADPDEAIATSFRLSSLLSISAGSNFSGRKRKVQGHRGGVGLIPYPLGQ